MNNLNDLKSTWLTANTDNLPNAQFIMNVVKPFRNHKLNRKIMIILLSLIMVVFFGVMMYLNRLQMVSTLIGQGLLMASLLILAYTNIRSVKRFYILNDCSNKEFINFLEQTRKNQIYYYKRTQVLSMILYSLAISFYLFEFVYKSTVVMICSYVALFAMLAIFWLIIRPKAYHKETVKLQKIIDRTKNLTRQFE